MSNDFWDYLSHHGIDGQRWGHRNGPPYPLSGSQMSKEERRQNKVSKFAKGKDKSPEQPKQNIDNVQKTNQQDAEPDRSKVVVKQLAKAQDVYRNRANLTDKELQDYINRYNKEQDLARLAQAEYEREHKTKMYINKKLNDYKDRALNNIANKIVDKGTKYVTDSLFPKEDYTMLTPSEVYSKVDKMSTNELTEYVKRYNTVNNIKKMAGEN